MLRSQNFALTKITKHYDKIRDHKITLKKVRDKYDTLQTPNIKQQQIKKKTNYFSTFITLHVK